MLQFWANADIPSKKMTVRSFAPESFFGFSASALICNRKPYLKKLKSSSAAQLRNLFSHGFMVGFSGVQQDTNSH